MDPAHRVAFADWLACAWRGRSEPAARAAGEAGDAAVWLGTAGHVLDFDDTYLPGLIHASAAAAPAALLAGAEAHARMGDVLRAHAAGFEAAAVLARTNHPALYDRGLHPTAVCGTVAAAVAAASALGLDARQTAVATALAALRSTGSRAGFGTDGKSLGVGLAAADGVNAARLAAGGAGAAGGMPEAAEAFATSTGGEWAAPQEGDEPAVRRNWIKPWPCCLMTHSAIEAALSLNTADRAWALDGPLVVRVHPRARQAAPYDDVVDPLGGKFSIPYMTAYALVRGAPDVEGLADVHDDVRAAAARIAVVEDPDLGESAARLEAPDDHPIAHVVHALGSPERPLDAGQLAEKVARLTGGGLDGTLDEHAYAPDVLHHLA